MSLELQVIDNEQQSTEAIARPDPSLPIFQNQTGREASPVQPDNIVIEKYPGETYFLLNEPQENMSYTVYACRKAGVRIKYIRIDEVSLHVYEKHKQTEVYSPKSHDPESFLQ